MSLIIIVLYTEKKNSRREIVKTKNVTKIVRPMDISVVKVFKTIPTYKIWVREEKKVN